MISRVCVFFFLLSGGSRWGQSGECKQIGATLEDEPINHTKWQNGFMGRDGCIYGIQHCGRTVVRVDMAREEVTTVPIPPPCHQLGKWEGGVMTPDGTMYCMPMSSKFVLKMTPGPAVPAPGGGLLPEASKGWGCGLAHD